MPARPVQISMDEGLLDRIDADPETQHRGRSAFIRSAAQLYLKVKERREIDRTIRSAYGSQPDEMLVEVEDLIEEQEWPET